jgi:5-methylcytosine-specific restriction endonuclease McrA
VAHKRWELDIPYAEWRRRRAIVLRGNPTCRYCPHPATTADHAIPLSKGGTSDLSNLVPACGPCNSAKRDGDAPKRGISPTKGNPHGYQSLPVETARATRPVPRLP